MQITLKNLLVTSFSLGVMFIVSLTIFIEGLIGRGTYIQFINEYWISDDFLFPLSFIFLIAIVLTFTTLLRWTSE